MLDKRILSLLLAVSIPITGFSIQGIKEASAATTSNPTYTSQFSSITLAKGYKDLTQANPCMTQRFAADPGVMEYNGRIYVYTTNDQYEYDSSGAVTTNTYSKIQTLNCMSSSDMVNWTDHGKINAAGSNGAAKWAGCSWAPTAAHKTINGKEKFFLYFANNANGIAVLTSDSPTGPWVDPIGKALISRSTTNCSDVTWLFDPAILVDSDGTGYLYFGGGVPTGQAPHPKTSRVVKLGSDMTSLAGTPVTIDAPYLFEDSGINKIGNTYYYSYCTNWTARSSQSDPGIAVIAYMTSSSPTGPFTYQGPILNNPGTFFGVTGNNHHSITQFNNKWYIFYHAQWLENKMFGTTKGYRSTQVDAINVNGGKISSATGTLTGVLQVKDLDPYISNQMSTMAWQGGINVSGSGDTTKVEMNAGDWVGVSNAAFGTGVASITMNVASQRGAVIKVCVDSPSSVAVGYISVPATGSTSTFTNVTADISNITGTKKLFFVSSGDCVVSNWKFSQNSTPTPIPTVTTKPTTTPTPTVTPTPTTTTGDIQVKIFNGTIAPLANTISPKVFLTNTGSTAINLSNVKIRYYYTSDGEQSQNFWCDWASVGSSNVTGKAVKMTTPKTNANYYLELGFTSTAGSLNPGSSIEIQGRLCKADWSNYTQTNDYSFNSIAISYIASNKVTAFINNSLKFGIEP